MLDRAHLLAMIGSLPVTDADSSPDFQNGVGSGVIRCIYDGQRAVVVGTDGKTQIGALLDLVDLHLHGGGTYKGQEVSADEVTVLFVEEPERREAEDALCTLAANVQSGPRIRLVAVSTKGALRPIEPVARTFEDAVEYRYTNFLNLLMRVEEPPDLLRDLVSAVDVPGYRAYPMLANRGSWSLRLDGLEVGRFRGVDGKLSVGQVGKFGGISPEREAWLEVAGQVVVTAGGDVNCHAVDVLRRFAAKWRPAPDPAAEATHQQNEHALESRILRGLVPISTTNGKRLTLLRPPPNVATAGRDALVNWGSQFPTRWGRTAAPGARYLDALLRDGSTPWALEIKVEGGGGVSQYYRHAVAQAVLYRQFIRTADPLKPWFDRYELDQTSCRAAVVVPEFLPVSANWEKRLENVCRAFDVDLIRVPRHFASSNDAEAA